MWRFLKKLEIELHYDPAIPLLGIHTEETRIERDTCRQILYQLRHKGSPRILEWVAYPFSSRSS